MTEPRTYNVEYDLPSEREYAYLCACIDHRFFEAVLKAFRDAIGHAFVYLETEAGGAPSFGSAPRSAELAYRTPEILARKMGWAAHGDKCAGFPGRCDEEMHDKLLVIARERSRDFPEATHYTLFATEHDGKVKVEVRELIIETPGEEAAETR